MKNTAIRIMAAASVAMMAISCGGSSKGEQAAAEPQEERVSNISVAAAVMKEVPQSEVYTATVQANVVNNIAPQGTSRIQKINVEVGDFVAAGQILAEMDRVNLDQSALKLKNDEAEFARIKGLYEEGGVSKSDYEAMELSMNVARSSYENILENTILRSPVDGVITARNYDRGDMFSMGQPIFVVQQITPVKLLVPISETDYTKVRKGDKVAITADAIPGKEFGGQIRRVYPTMDASSHTFNAEVIVSNGSRELRPGMYARVTVTFGVNQSVVIPDTAVSKQQGSGVRMVYVLQDDSTVKATVVTLGRHIGSEYEILSGLSEGDKVAVKGITTLTGGAKVKVVGE